MHALRSTRNLLAGLGLAAVMIGSMPHSASALPGNPLAFGTKSSYKLFSRLISFINVNRVYMGVNTLGEVGVDSAGRGTTQGGFWPRGTADNYVFNSGVQVAGVIAGVKSATNPWGGDTTGGWFFDGQGGRTQTEAVTPAYQAFNTADAANWPADAFVPQGDDVANLYAQPLQGLVTASQGDVHFISWDGNPKLNTGRLHPLGVMVDYRLLAWNYPAGAQDIVFVVTTIYNITSANCSDYAAQRPALAAIACQQGQKFQLLNNAQFNITLPVGGYTITNAFTAFAGDNDVGTVNSNYNGVILPFAMGYTYDGPFGNNAAGWKFDPSIFSAPFFVGIGFVGYKYLKGPDGPGAIQLMSTFCNGAATCGAGHADPASMGADYRLMAGQPYPTDGQCNITSPGLTPSQIHVCFMLIGSVGTDTRMLESSTQTSLAPGQSKSVVIAYVYAAPVAIPGFTPNGTNVTPGDVTRTNSTDSMYKYNLNGTPGANKIDSISGFLAYNGPHFNADGSVHTPVQTEFSVVKGSLLGKALVAQAVFDAHFLQEFAPDSPPFFLIPGNKQVTILWKPSPTETTGDPFFSVVSSPTELSAGGQTIANPLYDPNYRQFDVEGYRIYRGRSDSPTALKLLIQFDYAGTKIKDFTGFVVIGNCAPELGILTDCPATTPAGVFPTPANPIPPLTAPTKFVAYNIGPQTPFSCPGNPTPACTSSNPASLPPLASPLLFVDQTSGTRLALNGGTTTIATVVDTVVSGASDASSGDLNPPLTDGGVPFIFIDVAGAPGCTGCGVNNGVNYFYSVTAFDVNAPGHGPTSLESARVTKQVVPQAAAGNFNNTAVVASGTFGRHGLLTDNVVPTLDPVTGEWSKAMPPANGTTLALAGFAQQAISGAGSVSFIFDSTHINSIVAAGTTMTISDFYRLVSNTGVVTATSVPFTILQTQSGGPAQAAGTLSPALVIDSALVAKFGGGGGYTIGAAFTVNGHTGGYYSGLPGRGCANSTGGNQLGNGTVRQLQCWYNGPRWFSGANESTADPTGGTPANGLNSGITSPWDPNATYNNAGKLTGVDIVSHPDAYGVWTGSNQRDADYMMGVFITSADYKVYWGTAGHVDSVIDVTHDSPVPFNANIGSSWGILNSNASAANVAGSFDQRPELSGTDFDCVLPVQTAAATAKPTCAAAQQFVQTAVPGPIVYSNGNQINLLTTTAGTNYKVSASNGFGMYLKGRAFTFELTGGALPAAGTVWTMRDYAGAFYGGHGKPSPDGGGDEGAYQYFPPPLRVLNAPGASVQFSFNIANALVPVTSAMLTNVHTVPDPYYVTSAYDIAVNAKDIQFVNVPTGATIRIYSSSGVLLRVLQNTTTQLAGIVHWDVRNRTNQFVSSGVYFYTVEAGGISHSGRMTIVNYASTVQ